MLHAIKPVTNQISGLVRNIYLLWMDWHIARMSHKPENAGYILKRNRIAQGNLF